MEKSSENVISNVENFVRTKLPEWFIDSHVEVVVDEALKLQKIYPSSDEEVITIASWLHDIGHEICEGPGYNRKVSEHHIVGEQISRDFLTSIDYDAEKMKHVLQCIVSHRTSRPPDPETIEAKIVFSADNLAHFSSTENIVKVMGKKKFFEKLERDLQCDMLPEAKMRAEKLFKSLKEV